MTEESKPKIENLETPEQELMPEEAEQAEGGRGVITLAGAEERGIIIDFKSLGGPDTLTP